MVITTIIEWMIIKQMNLDYNNKKEIFSELCNRIFENQTLYSKIWCPEFGEVRISSLKNQNIIEEIRTLKVIDLDNLESFISYINYDHFLIFKNSNDYYFCDTEYYPQFGFGCLIKLSDFNLYLRKDKMKKIQENSI